MTLRHLAPAPLLAVAIFACTPSVPSNPNTYIVTAAFDPTTGNFPLPSALAINPLLNPYVLHPRNAQDELLAYFYDEGGFPPDQVLPLGFPIAALTVNGPNDVTSAAPAIDLRSIVPCTGQQAPGNCNLFVFDALGTPAQAFPALATSYEAGATQGTLSAVPVSGGKPTTWRPGATYFYALRGGANGIKTQANVPLQPSSTMYTLLFGQPGDFTCPSTSPDCALKDLEQLQLLFQPIFAAVQNKGFPLQETVVVGAFTVAPATTWVIADPGAGVVPLPSNFLLDPGPDGKVSKLVDELFFGLPFSSLDGFSTTGMDIAQTSGPVSARSIQDGGVYFYKLAGATAEKPSTIYIQPPPITIDPSTGHPCAPDDLGAYGPTCVSMVIGLQPAVPVPTMDGTMALKPLEEQTDYAVLITKNVTDPSGIPISKTTLGQIVLFDHPICSPSPGCAADPTISVSQLAGVSAVQASQLEEMRLTLQPAVSKLATDHGIAKADIAMPYTFRTQSITMAALQLGAAPYAKLPGTSTDAFPDAPVGAVKVAPAAMAAKWGVPPELLALGISTFIEANVISFDKLDPTTGAFNPVPAAGTITPLPAIIAIPNGAPPSGGWPLVVFHHGLTRSRGDMLLAAASLAGSGMVVAAIDAPKHGARAWCMVNTTVTPNVATGCATGVACNTAIFAQQGGDAPTAKPGLCTDNALRLAPIASGAWNGQAGNSVTSGAFFTTVNFFRWRDTARQDILDQSMLVRVLTSANGVAVLAAAAEAPVTVNPSRVFYLGQSLGSIEGTVDVAANPRISRVALSVGGATWVDIMTSSVSLRPLYLAALASLGITLGSTENLLLLIAAHWVLDPADPANFAGHLVQAPLTNLLVAPPAPMAAKVVFGQGARCDATVPNSTNQLLYGLIGLGPPDPTVHSATPGLQWYMDSESGTCPTDGTAGPGVGHGFLLDWSNPALAAKAQSNMARFLLELPVDPSPVTAPFAP